MLKVPNIKAEFVQQTTNLAVLKRALLSPLDKIFLGKKVDVSES